ncbi:MAG: hypothetical protein AB7F91_06925 [Parvularculaceae bacterium]
MPRKRFNAVKHFLANQAFDFRIDQGFQYLASLLQRAGPKWSCENAPQFLMPLAIGCQNAAFRRLMVGDIVKSYSFTRDQNFGGAQRGLNVMKAAERGHVDPRQTNDGPEVADYSVERERIAERIRSKQIDIACGIVAFGVLFHSTSRTFLSGKDSASGWLRKIEP